MRVQVYLPDDLGERLKQHGDLNVSAVCQLALRRALDAVERAAEGSGEITLDPVKTLHEVEAGTRRWLDLREVNRPVTFRGREVYRAPQLTFYVTEQQRALVVYSQIKDGEVLIFPDVGAFLNCSPYARDLTMLAAEAVELELDPNRPLRLHI